MRYNKEKNSIFYKLVPNRDGGRVTAGTAATVPIFLPPYFVR